MIIYILYQHENSGMPEGVANDRQVFQAGWLSFEPNCYALGKQNLALFQLYSTNFFPPRGVPIVNGFCKILFQESDNVNYSTIRIWQATNKSGTKCIECPTDCLRTSSCLALSLVSASYSLGKERLLSSASDLKSK